MGFGRKTDMAVMYPADLENYECTATEKDMYFALKEQLSDKFHVFYSVRWFETNDENKRVDSECDFLVFDPSFGYLTIEVKGGTGIEVENGHWFLIENYGEYSNTRRELKCSPYEQSEKSMRHFFNYFADEFNQTFNGVYGFAVAFPRYNIDQPLTPSSPLELTIDLADMSILPKRINEIFHYWKNFRNINVPFSAAQKQRLITIINKRISLSAAAGALIPIKKKEFEKIDFVQESILDILYHYNQAQIIGGAGTGKTYIAMKKVNRDLKKGKKVLFLCCNSELVKFVSTALGSVDGLKCCTYEDLMIETLTDVYADLNINENGNKCCFDEVANKDVETYDSILVDEAQDFDADMGLTVRLFLKDEDKSDLYVFYDVNQNVFKHKFSNAFSIGYPPFILRYNIRNTGNIYNYAVNTTGLGKDTVANNLLGVKPEIRKYRNVLQAINGLNSIINRLTNKEYVSNKSIVILSDEPYEQSIIASETRVGKFMLAADNRKTVGENEICFRTAEEFKGLEADIIIYLKNEYANTIMDDIKLRKEYVALTRARYYLYILQTKRK